MTYSTKLIFLAIGAGMVSIACTTSTSGTTTTGGGGGQGGLGGSSTGDTGGTGGTGDTVQQHVDLFSCGLTLDCEQMTNHINPEPPSALTCAAKLVVSGSAGVLSAVSTPGPYFTQDERLIIVLGDGTALVQSRFRECKTNCVEPIPWEPSSAHQICDVLVGDGVEAACAGGDEMACAWSPWSPGGLTNCQDVEDRECADVGALLD